MQNQCFKRLKKEAQSLSKELGSDEFVSLVVDPDNIRSWRARITGPEGSAYHGYDFYLAIRVGEDYPLSPPRMSFETKIFHPNVHFDSGEICLDILKREWSPAWSLVSACRAIVALLASPAPDSPLNCDAGNMLRAGDDRAFRSVCTLYCAEFAPPRGNNMAGSTAHSLAP